jgi:hypothetical protein
LSQPWQPAQHDKWDQHDQRRIGECRNCSYDRPRSVTCSVTEADASLAPLLVTSAPAGSVFTYEPAAAMVTSTVSVQLLSAGIENPAGSVSRESRPPSFPTEND